MRRIYTISYTYIHLRGDDEEYTRVHKHVYFTTRTPWATTSSDSSSGSSAWNGAAAVAAAVGGTLPLRCRSSPWNSPNSSCPVLSTAALAVPSRRPVWWPSACTWHERFGTTPAKNKKKKKKMKENRLDSRFQHTYITIVIVVNS